MFNLCQVFRVDVPKHTKNRTATRFWEAIFEETSCQALFLNSEYTATANRINTARFPAILASCLYGYKLKRYSFALSPDLKNKEYEQQAE